MPVASRGFTPQVAQRINDVTSMISLVSAGVGVALVPLSARALRLDNVVYIDSPGSAGGE
ncbi:LysR family transcriptional regulator [Klebsiella pneumoniae]|uniref:LysR family transcriptional regulator n=1 Tax=Klebsiella pneumoniae TaxID=573 RepID=A0A377WJ90_KLEPN|nr:LysR family transcriptional regulator [Klebsiella pneumoniae]